MTEELFADIFCHSFGIRMSHTRNTGGISQQTGKQYFGTFLPECFGVFVTIERKSRPSRTGNSKTEKQVHGCIGRMNFKPTRNNRSGNLFGFHSLAPAELYTYCLDVTRSAIFNDSRRENFPIDIHFDPFANIVISFMLLPVSLMDENHPNKKYGLICVSEKGDLTTFLPDVFPEKRLSDIKQDLLMKAGAQKCRNWIEYKTVVVGCTFNEIMYVLLRKQKRALENFIDDYFAKSDFIFYAIDPKGNFQIEKSQLIRNLACIETLYQLTLRNDTKSKLMSNYNFYSINQNGFVRDVQEKVAVDSNRNKNDLCKKSVFESITDLDFTLAQFGIYVSKHCPGNKNLENQILSKLKKRLVSINPTDDYDQVFFLNWFVQFLFHQGLGTYKAFRKISKRIMKKLYSLIHRKEFIDLETNYLAVVFESLCHLLVMYWDEKTFRYIFYLFIHLEKRIRYDCMFSFLDQSSRLDITCHVWNGIILLIDAQPFIVTKNFE